MRGGGRRPPTDQPHPIPSTPHLTTPLQPTYPQHHAGYVTKLIGMIKGTEYESASLDDIMLKAPAGGLFNNAAQIWNHSFYWNSLAPNAGGLPTGPIADAINDSFGSFDAFKVRPYIHARTYVMGPKPLHTPPSPRSHPFQPTRDAHNRPSSTRPPWATLARAGRGS